MGGERVGAGEGEEGASLRRCRTRFLWAVDLLFRCMVLMHLRVEAELAGVVERRDSGDRDSSVDVHSSKSVDGINLMHYRCIVVHHWPVR